MSDAARRKIADLCAALADGVIADERPHPAGAARPSPGRVQLELSMPAPVARRLELALDEIGLWLRQAGLDDDDGARLTVLAEMMEDHLASRFDDGEAKR